MIREAERMDKDAIQSLYKFLCPNDPVNVLPERIEQIKNDQNNFLFVYEEAAVSEETIIAFLKKVVLTERIKKVL